MNAMVVQCTKCFVSYKFVPTILETYFGDIDRCKLCGGPAVRSEFMGKPTDSKTNVWQYRVPL